MNWGFSISSSRANASSSREMKLSPSSFVKNWSVPRRYFPVRLPSAMYSEGLKKVHVLLLLLVAPPPGFEPRGTSLPLARYLECSKQGILLPGTGIQDPIDEERWGALHSAAFATLPLLLDTGQGVLFCQRTRELLHLQTNRLGKACQVRVLKGMLMVEDIVMHLPELSLRGCRLRLWWLLRSSVFKYCDLCLL